MSIREFAEGIKGGTGRVRMDDGTEKDFKAGDVSSLGAGHDGWVVGDEPVVVVDFQGMTDYAKGSGEMKSSEAQRRFFEIRSKPRL